MTTGFAPRQLPYTLTISSASNTFKVAFTVSLQGRLKKTDRQAINTAVAAWGVVMHGSQCDGYTEIVNALGDDVVNQLVSIQRIVSGEAVTGKLRDGSGYLLASYASEMGLVSGLEVCAVLPAAQHLN